MAQHWATSRSGGTFMLQLVTVAELFLVNSASKMAEQQLPRVAEVGKIV
jgi:hypothetical protein